MAVKLGQHSFRQYQREYSCREPDDLVKMLVLKKPAILVVWQDWEISKKIIKVQRAGAGAIDTKDSKGHPFDVRSRFFLNHWTTGSTKHGIWIAYQGLAFALVNFRLLVLRHSSLVELQEHLALFWKLIRTEFRISMTPDGAVREANRIWVNFRIHICNIMKTSHVREINLEVKI